MPFENENSRFRTDTTKGHSHGTNPTRGSVFSGPISGAQGTDYTLWLEHAVEKKTGENLYWFVWYDPSGNCSTQTSAVLHKNDLIETAQRLLQVPDA
jgi:hypothetical protein